MLSTLNRAILEHRVVEIEYQPPGRTITTRKIEPYAIVFYQSSLYIIAAAQEVNEGSRIRHLKLDRFHKTTALDEWFKPDPEFKLEQYLGQSLGIFGSGGAAKRFKIRINAYAAAWVQEDPWHPRQQIEKQSDGGIVLTVEAANEMEIIPRVLALGENAEVLSPASCRKTMAKIAQRLAEMYGPE
jgi:predicted DNA-binding transcriptional regulator YafY